ncbi:MAG TPA: YceI family protein [Blastocatellia bacterium]
MKSLRSLHVASSIGLLAFWVISVCSPAIEATGARCRVEPAENPSFSSYRIDANRSNFMVHVGVSGLLSGFAHNHNIAIRGVSGEVGFQPDNPNASSLRMTVDSNSLAVTDKISDKDRQQIEATTRDEVLESSKFPQIIFKSTEVSMTKTGEGQYEAKVFGDLTLHGVTRHGLINAKIEVSGNTIRARGEFPLRQTEYNIKLVSVAGGTVKVKDELRFTFDIVAVS